MEDFRENMFLKAAFGGKYSNQRRRAEPVLVRVTAPALYQGPALPVLRAGQVRKADKGNLTRHVTPTAKWQRPKTKKKLMMNLWPVPQY